MKLCYFYQKAVAWHVDSPSTPRWLERHLDACPACRHFQRDQARLVSALTATAEAHVTATPPFLHSRIVASLPSPSEQADAPVLWHRWLQAALIPALSVLLVMAYLVRKSDLPRFFQPESSPAAGSQTAAVDQLLPQDGPNRLFAWTEQVDLPLQTELDSVVTDAKSAFQLLAGNFLPDQATPRTEPAQP
jgi:hypothetical protein